MLQIVYTKIQKILSRKIMPVNIISHPLLAHKIALLRQEGVSTKQFRELANEVASLLTYESTRDLPIEDREIQGWQGEPIKTQMLSGKKLSIVPILRAGLGMLDGVLTLVPNAKVSVVGLYRDEETLNPVAYFDKIIEDIDQRTALIIDPMLATGGTLLATIDLLKEKGCKKIIGCRGSFWTFNTQETSKYDSIYFYGKEWNTYIRFKSDS